MVLHPTPAASVPARYSDILNPGGGRCGAPGSWVLFPSCRGCSARLAPARRMSIRTQRYRSEEHTSELQSLMRNSYAVFCLKKKKQLDGMTFPNLEQRKDRVEIKTEDYMPMPERDSNSQHIVMMCT